MARYLCLVLLLLLLVHPAAADTQTIPLVSGFNFITPVITPAVPQTSRTLMDNYSAIHDVFQFDSTSQQFKFQLRLEDGSYFGEALNLNPGDGLVLKAAEPLTIQITGTFQASDSSLQLLGGFNLRGFRLSQPLAAGNLLTGKNQVNSVFAWDSVNQLFKFMLLLNDGSLFGENFFIQSGEAIFLNASSPTVVSLPDTLPPDLPGDAVTVSGDSFILAFPGGTDVTGISVAGDPLLDVGMTRSGDAIQVSNLPETGHDTISIHLKMPDGTVLDSSYHLVTQETIWIPSLQTTVTRPRFLKTSRNGQWLQAELPPVAAVAAAPGRQPSRASTPVQTFWVVTGWLALQSDDGKFEVLYPAEAHSAVEQTLIPALKSGRSMIESLGFDWSRRSNWPLQVTVSSLSTPGNTVYGLAQTSIAGINYHSLAIDGGDLSANGLTLRTRTVWHELFHLAQFLYDPRNSYTQAKSAGSWLWLDEASAVWFEEYASRLAGNGGYLPEIMVSNIRFPKERCLDASSLDNATATTHGYGAAMFLRYLERSTAASTIGALIRRKSDGSSPLAALNATTNLATVWADFIRSYVIGDIYTGTTAAPEPAMVASSTSSTTYLAWNDTREIQLPLPATPDLAARFVWINLDDNTSVVNYIPPDGGPSIAKPWAADTKLTITLNTPAGDVGQGALYRYQNGAFTLVDTINGSVTIEDIAVQAEADSNSWLKFLVAFAHTDQHEPPTTADLLIKLKLDTLRLDAITPALAPRGDTVTLTGSGFGTSQNGSRLVHDFNNDLEIVSWSDTVITFKVPMNSSVGMSVSLLRSDGYWSNNLTLDVQY